MNLEKKYLVIVIGIVTIMAKKTFLMLVVVDVVDNVAGAKVTLYYILSVRSKQKMFAW